MAGEPSGGEARGKPLPSNSMKTNRGIFGRWKGLAIMKPRAKSHSHRLAVGGFTLIELLIVVAILAILAGIAAVNYQGFQSRSKVARALADMRTVAAAIETYKTDNQAYPPAALGDLQLAHPLDVLTDPVAYLSAIPGDPFGLAPFDFNPGLKILGYNYKDRRTTSTGMPGETYGHIWAALPDKEYLLHSCGPNRVWDVTPYVDYDPTNGTTSAGDICRFGPM